MKTFEQFKYDFLKRLNLNFDDFTLTDDQFDHQSTVHGINHIFRVMFNCLLIGKVLNDVTTTRRAFMAAYIHDLARTHDNSCMAHGPNSAKYKLPLYEKLFRKNGSTDTDLSAIKLAVTNHSHQVEIEKSDPYYKTVALLRDADGLDLVRLDREINPHILRYRESRRFIDTAQVLFEATDDEDYYSFNEFLEENILFYEKF